MQKVTLIGNLGKDPEERATNGGVKVLNFSLAVQVTKEITCWYECSIWGDKIAAFKGLLPYLKKGSKVCLMGDLCAPEVYQAKDGSHRAKLRVNPFSIQFVNSGEKKEEPKKVPLHEMPF